LPHPGPLSDQLFDPIRKLLPIPTKWDHLPAAFPQGVFGNTFKGRPYSNVEPGRIIFDVVLFGEILRSIFRRAILSLADKKFLWEGA